MKMMLEDNFTHSDLHPGNVLVRFDPEGEPSLVLLDVGLVTELRPRGQFLGVCCSVCDCSVIIVVI